MPAYTDITTTGWVARLPPMLRPYALLARLDRPIGAWLLFLPGAWGILLASPAVWRAIILLALFALGSVAMRAAGCVVNDLWDREIDRKVTRTAGRPLASGALRPWQALVFLAALLLIGLVILLQLNHRAQILGVCSLLLVGLYPAAKRVTSWPQLVLGFTFGAGAPIGYVAASNRIDVACVALYAAAILWILGFDTIYAHQDRDDDMVIGIGSTALVFQHRTAPFVAGCYTLVLMLLAVAGGFALLSPVFYLALLPAALSLIWQVWRLDIENPASCLRLFRLNRETGLLVALAILAGRV